MPSSADLMWIAIAVGVIALVQMVLLIGVVVLGISLHREVARLRATIDAVAEQVGSAAAQVQSLALRAEETVQVARQTAASVGAVFGAGRVLLQGLSIGGLTRRRPGISPVASGSLWLMALRLGVEAVRRYRAKRRPVKPSAPALAGRSENPAAGTIGPVRRIDH